MRLFTAHLLLCDVLITEFGADVIDRHKMTWQWLCASNKIATEII